MTKNEPVGNSVDEEMKKKRKNTLIVAGVILALVILMIIGFGISSLLARKYPSTMVDIIQHLGELEQEFEDTLHPYFLNIRDGDYESAFQYTAQSELGTQTLEEFIQSLDDEGYPEIDTYLGVYVQSFDSTSASDSEKELGIQNSASFTALVLSEDNQSQTISGVLVFINGKWHVMRIKILTLFYERINE